MLHAKEHVVFYLARYTFSTESWKARHVSCDVLQCPSEADAGWNNGSTRQATIYSLSVVPPVLGAADVLDVVEQG